MVEPSTGKRSAASAIVGFPWTNCNQASYLYSRVKHHLTHRPAPHLSTTKTTSAR
jgi:hypothetical protein